MESTKAKRITAYILIGVVILGTIITYVVLRDQNLKSQNAWIETHRNLGRSNLIIQAARHKVTQMAQPDFSQMDHFLSIISTQVGNLITLHQEGEKSYSKLKLDPGEAILAESRFVDVMTDFKQRLLLTRKSEQEVIAAFDAMTSKYPQASLKYSEFENLSIGFILAMEKLNNFGQEKLFANLDKSIEDLQQRSREIALFTNSSESAQIEKAVLDFASNLNKLKESTEVVLESEEPIRQAALNLFYSIEDAAAASKPLINSLFYLAAVQLLVLAGITAFFAFRLKHELIYQNSELEGTVEVRTQCLEMVIEDLKESSAKQLKIEEELRLAHRLEAIGQLSAGIAHEINTPAQFVSDNLRFVMESQQDIASLRQKYANEARKLASEKNDTALIEEFDAAEDDIDLEFLEEEIPAALANSIEGMERISKIVKSMKDFSHPGSEDRQPVNLNVPRQH